MKRSIALAPIVALLVAACGGGDPAAEAPSTTVATLSPAGTGTTSPSSPGSTVAGETTTTTAATAPTTSDRPIAPDFTLALGDGGSFTLSDEQKPVYMVFWAEW